MNPVIRLACAQLDARPLFWTEPDGSRHGYEPEVAELVFEHAGYTVEWVFSQWNEFLPLVVQGDVDGVWCGMGIIPEREEIVNFTDPYTVFNESVVVRANVGATNPNELAGLRIGAIIDSANMRLAKTFPGIELVGFDGATDDVFGDMISATRSGEIDGFVDDDVVMVPLDDDPELRLAFTIETKNPWGMGIAKGNDELRIQVNDALAAIKSDGRLQQVWKKWLPANLRYPF